MWFQAPSDWCNATSPPSKLQTGDEDSRRHSSQGQSTSNDSPPMLNAENMPPLRISQVFSGPLGVSQVFSAPLGSSQSFGSSHALCNPGSQLGDPAWSPSPLMLDAFADDGKSQTQERRTAYEGSEDQSMVDFSRSMTPSSEHLDADYNNSKLSFHDESTHAIAESQFEEMMATFVKEESRTFVRADGRSTSAALTDIFASTGSGPFSFPDEQRRAVPVTTRDPPPPGSREHSDISMSSGSSETLALTRRPLRKVKRNPALIIRSKKEGMASAHKGMSSTLTDGVNKENHKCGQENPVVVSDGSRKVSALHSRSTPQREVSNSTPTRKTSRMRSDVIADGLDATEFATNGTDRAPLGEIYNNQ